MVTPVPPIQPTVAPWPPIYHGPIDSWFPVLFGTKPPHRVSRITLVDSNSSRVVSPPSFPRDKLVSLSAAGLRCLSVASLRIRPIWAALRIRSILWAEGRFTSCFTTILVFPPCTPSWTRAFFASPHLLGTFYLPRKDILQGHPPHIRSSASCRPLWESNPKVV